MIADSAPRISVVLPVYNGVATICRALESILAQTLTAWEIICVDDGSTDGTADALRRYGGRLRVIAQKNLGPSAARNAGARSASGEFLVFFDADDVMRPAMLARCVRAFSDNPRAVLVYVNAEIVDDDGRVLRTSMVAPDRDHAPTLDELLSHIWPIVPSTAMMRRSAFETVGGFNETLRSCEDIYFWLLMRERGEFVYVLETLVAKTEHQVFPKVLERDPGAREFTALVRQRYGVRANGLVRDFRSLKTNLLARCGREALAAGKPDLARRCFLRAISYAPGRVKNYRRLLGTFFRPSIG